MTSSGTVASGKGLRTGKAIPSCRRNMPEGPGLPPSCLQETCIAMLSLQYSISMIQSIMGSWVWMVTGSESVRALIYRTSQYVASSFLLNKVYPRAKRTNFLYQMLWGNLQHYMWSRDPRGHEKRSQTSPVKESLRALTEVPVDFNLGRF